MVWKLYTIPEAAKILRLSKNTVYELVYTGRLQASKLGRKKGWRVTEEALREFLKKEELGAK